MIENSKVERTSGNVFADLGVKKPEKASAKANLAWKISELINQSNLNQSKVAELLEIDQPKVSALLR